MQIIFCIASVALFLFGLSLVYKANGKPVYRYRQLGLPLVALLFGIFTVVKFDEFYRSVQALLTMATEYLPFLSSFNLTFVAVCVFNFLILASFAVVKCIYRGIVALLARPLEKIFNYIIDVFYYYDDEFQHWYLRVEYQGVRRLILNLYVAAVVVAVLLFICGQFFSRSVVFANPFYPALAVVVLGEMSFCLSGVTKQEYIDDIDFEDDGANRIFQYAKLQEILEHYFGDRELQTYSHGARSGSAGTHDDFCRNLRGSRDFAERLAGGYFQGLVDKGILSKNNDSGRFDDLNHDVALRTVELLQGKSVLFSTPFYRDYVPYVFLPANEQLLKNRHVLVLYGPEADEEAVRSYLAEGLSFVTGVPEMWTIGQFGDATEENPDVALLSFSALGDVQCVLSQADYLRDVSLVFVIDPSSLLATCQIGLSFLAEYLSFGEPVCYCIFDRNCDGLIDSLSHALRTNLVEVAATEFAEGSSVSLYWDVDGEHLQHRLLPGVSQYLGVGTELGLVALKSQASNVLWASNAAVPLIDQRWINGQYYGELLTYAELPQEQLQLDDRFSYYYDMWSIGKKKTQFIIAEDEYRNLFEVSRQFATRGTEQAFVNVLSPNYILRTYMADNPEVFAADPKAVPALAPDFSKSRRNLIFSIVMAMAQSKDYVSEKDIRERLNYVGIPINNTVREALEGLLIDYLYANAASKELLPEEHLIERDVEEYDSETRTIISKKYFGISDDALFSSYFSSLRNIPLMTEQPDGTRLLLGSRLYGHVYQTLLPGQFIVMQGKYYEALSISSEVGVILRRAADHFNRRRYYRQLRTYRLQSWTQGEDIGDARTVSQVKIERIYATFSVSTDGYLDLADYGDLRQAKCVELLGIPIRSYANKSALRLCFDGASQEVMETLAVLINEFFVTLFPKDYPYLAVVVAGETQLPEGALAGYSGEHENGVIYILEDSLIDIGLLTSVDRNIQRILELCWDYLDWHKDQLEGRHEVSPEWEPGDMPTFTPPPTKKSLVRRFIDFFATLFTGKDESEKSPEADKEQPEEAEITLDEGGPHSEGAEQTTGEEAAVEASEGETIDGIPLIANGGEVNSDAQS